MKASLRPAIGFLVVLATVGAIVLLVTRSSPQPPRTTKPAGAELASNHPSEAVLANPSLRTTPTKTSGPRQIPQQQANSTNAPLISRLLDTSLALKARRQAARELARIGSDEAISALTNALAQGPPYLKAAIAEALAESPHPAAKDLVLGVLNGSDETAARGAIRGLGLRGDAASAQVLEQTLFDPDKPESLRTEAALAIGDIRQPSAMDTLTRAINELQDDTIAENVLHAVGKRPFTETEGFFRAYLESPSPSPELKAAALESLNSAEGDPSKFLLGYTRDTDPQLRAAAAWALVGADSTQDLAPQLIESIKSEPEAEIRARLYQALANQNTVDTAAVLDLAQKESDPSARLAGLNALAAACRSHPNPELSAYFNQNAVPELTKDALNGGDSQTRLGSVIALRRAGTSEADAALAQIAAQSNDPRVVEATRIRARR